jgi:hypothetical protein
MDRDHDAEASLRPRPLRSAQHIDSLQAGTGAVLGPQGDDGAGETGRGAQAPSSADSVAHRVRKYGRLEDNLVFLLERAPPAQRGLPERRDRRRVLGVDAQALDAYPP